MTLRHLLFPFVVSGFLITVSFHNFLLFHTLAELFSVCVAVLLCVVAWQTYPFSKNNFLMYLACGFFWVGTMDLVHALAYKGMNIFPIAEANPATQFWIATRYFQAFVMLTAPYFTDHKVNKHLAFMVFGTVAVVFYALIMSGNFPDAFVEGQGLTAFKINSEYTIIVILAWALAWLVMRRTLIEPRVFILLTVSLILTMGSELAFTFYVSVYGLSNLVGHIFKILAFWMIYEAVIRQSLQEPYLELEQRVLERTDKYRESELKLLEIKEKLQNTVSQLQATLEATADGILVVSDVGQIETFNNRFVEQWGLPDEIIASKDDERAISFVLDQLTDPQGFIDKVKELYGVPEAKSYDRLEFKDGRVFERYSRPKIVENVITGRVWSFRDVSEVETSKQNLTTAKIEAEVANRAKSDFLSSMSHELRTPMNAILGFAQMLQYNSKEPLSETQNSSVNLILRGGNHLLELIEQVLKLSNIEAGRISLNIDYTTVREVIDDSLNLIQSRADTDGIKIIDQIGRDELPLLWTDSTRLTQVLLNLLSNAVKYNRENGTVTLSCLKMPNEMLRISVADTGRGIPFEKQKDLFKPFERLGRESGTIEGTGIGLTITKQIIELLGGQVGFVSEEERGSTFYVDIPISEKLDVDLVDLEITKPSGKAANKPNKNGSRYSVLYVEDNPDNMKLMEVLIGQVANTRLLTACNAELGLDLAKSERPDLILMDINLPGMNGIEALKRLQETTETKDIPVIAITAAAMSKDVKAGLKAGFKDYITKPINVPEFIRTIEETLDSIKKSD